MKKYLNLLTALCLALCLALTALAVPSAVDESSDETAEILADTAIGNVAESIVGYAPEEVVTGKELVSVVVRFHSTLNSGNVSTEYNSDAYYNYAVNNGIFSASEYPADDSDVTRKQVVKALYNVANGKIDLTAINNVLDMIDVDPNADYHTAAFAFMKAGIITGYNDYGSFKPSNTVKRYELGLMVDRLLNPSERVTKEYKVYTTDEPVYLIDDFLLDLGARGWYTGGSGWRIDYTGSTEVGTINNYANILRDYAVDDNMATYRRIHTQDSGELVFETVYEFTSGDTLHFAFYDVDDNVIATAGWQGGYAHIGGTSTSIKLADKKEPYRTTDVNQFNHYMAYKVRTRIILDLDNGEYEVWMGDDCLGTAALSGKNLAKVGIYTGDAETSVVELDNTHLWKNYKVNDVFRLENQDEAPVGYDVTGNVTVARLLSNANNTGEVNSVKVALAAGETATASKSFDKASGKVIAEAYLLLDNGNTASDVVSNASFVLKSEDVPVIMVGNSGNKWCANGTFLDLTTPDDEFTSIVWQWIRIEADTNTQTATVKINGKVAGTVDFYAKVDGFDGLTIQVTNTSGAEDIVWFDDIEVYETFVDYYNTDTDPDNDYVPTPVPLDTGDYILNMSVCNLWRNGSHYGWDWIRPFSELEPALGYYDEGNPESMDWEIKYLVEHGIKNYMTCWYPHSGGEAIKKPRMIDAIHDGYFNAKYSDMMTFSLMFENSGYISDSQRKDFVERTFPLWMDWYFSDPRYCRIKEDGKEYIFLTIYQYLYFLDMACTDYELLTYNENGDLYLKSEYQPSGTTLSSAVTAACADAAELIQWMENQIVAAGYADGLIVVYGGSAQSDAAYKTMSKMGGDGIILYAWGKTACDVEAQKTLATNHTAYAKAQGIDLLTLATPGFNDIGWTSLRPGYMSTDNFETMLNWHKSQMATNYGSSADSWKSKFITFDTWNEYGEGHYFFPTAAYDDRLGYGGFGYLDVIAEVFGGVARDSAAGDANNTYPTEVQKARMGSLYPNDMDHYIRRELIETTETPTAYKRLGGYGTMTGTGNYSSSSNWACMRNHSLHWYGCYKYPVYESTDGGRLHGKTDSDYARINFENSQFAGVNMDDVSYIHMVMQTGTGGSTGKIYFKNSTDTSQYSGYAEERIFRFNTYADKTEYYINVKEHKLWTGTLAGLMLECTNETGEDVYLYTFELITEDESTKKPTIYVDKQKYDCKDYGEIRTAPSTKREEIYMAPTEEGGLYKLLHIVYNWNRSTNILKLDTPNGTTFEFNYNTHEYKKNGTVVGKDSANIVLYDGAPVIPLIWLLDEAGYVYSYDFTNKKINITVANTFEIDTQITNGDAEGADATEFYNSGYNVAIVTDPKDSSNKVWDVPSKDSKVWTYIRTDFTWTAGKTYTIDFDARRTGLLGDGSDHPTDSSKLVFNARYTDTAGSNGVEHNPEATKVTITDDWQHFTIQYTVADTLDATSTFAQQLTFYADPYNDLGVPFQMDNIVVRMTPMPFKLLNGDAEDTSDDIEDQSEGFYSGHSGNPLTIETDGTNHYWKLTSKQVGNNSYSYIRQKTAYEKGVTYYYKVRAKIGTNAAGENVSSARITLNARYYDSAKLGQSGEWYSHSYDLSYATNGNVVYFNTGNDWVTCKGSFTISQGYQPNGGPNGNIPEEITFYMAPSNTSGVTFMIDDFVVTTDPDVYASW